MGALPLSLGGTSLGLEMGRSNLHLETKPGDRGKHERTQGMESMNRFLVFSGYTYYPGGGWEDYRIGFPTLEAAEEYVKQYPADWWQIVDLITLRVVNEDA